MTDQRKKDLEFAAKAEAISHAAFFEIEGYDAQQEHIEKRERLNLANIKLGHPIGYLLQYV